MISFTIHKKIAILVLFFFSSFLWSYASSITFRVSPSEIKKGDTVIVDVRISATNEKINAIDGAVVFDPNYLEIQSISTSDSVFTLWTRKPSESRKLGIVLFTGGRVDAFTGEGTVFKVAVKAKKDGVTPIVVANNTALYIHNGKGTSVTPDVLPFVLVVGKNKTNDVTSDHWQTYVSSDRTIPSKITTLLGRDSFSYDGKYFVSFDATDKESGIHHYEIQEGSRDVIISESPYVLVDQSLNNKIIITAVDNAGNKISTVFNPYVARMTDSTIFRITVSIFFVIIVILLVKYFLFKMKRK